MNLGILSDILGIIGFFLTVLTLVATLNVRSQVIHSHERKTFKASYKQIIAQLDGFIKSLSVDYITTIVFYEQIDMYITDLSSKYTFLNYKIQLKFKMITHKISHKSKDANFNTDLAKYLVQLRNLLEKESSL